MSLRPRQSTGVSSPANQRKKAPKDSTTPRAIRNNRVPSYLKPGAAVEISSDESGFRGSWFPGRVVTAPSSDKDFVKCQVEYTTLFFDKELKKPLKEVVHTAQLRPPAPSLSESEKKRDFAVGEKVDAYYNDGWWEGEVMKVLGDGKFSVYFRTSREQIEFHRDQLRYQREWVNGAWKPPLEEREEEESEDDKVDDTEDEEDLLSQVDPETARAIAKQMFSSGTIVEVSSEEEGFKGSWFVAKVIERIGEDNYLVEYRDLREENGVEPLKEEADFLHMRPLPPPSEDYTDFAVGDKVDAFYNDGWWVGDVIESLQDGRVGIFFRQSREKMRFGRLGLRLHKDWVNGTWQLALKRGEKRPKVLQRVSVSCDRNVRPKKEISKQVLSIGTPVEVSSEEEGFEDSWFPAKLVEYRGLDKCLVEYDKLKAEDAKEPLREEVKVIQIRPQPVERIMVNSFEKLDKVDAFYNDGWWVGVIVKILAKSNYLVNFEKTGEVLKFNHFQLRLHQEWIDGKWITSSKSQKV
uniref:Agenet domain-containing protein n=1 Tax=Noccaea caerulescens TaxID=107243 RepID=A0A1J3GX38_NOCCA